METKPDYEALFRASPYPHLMVDKNLMIVDANEAYIKIVGTTAQRLVGRWIFDAFPENPADPASTSVRQVKSSIERAIATGKPDTTPVLRYAVPVVSGDSNEFQERYWSAVHTPVFDQDGEVAFIVQNPLDVTHLYRSSQTPHPSAGNLTAFNNVDVDSFSQVQMHEAMMRILRDERSHLRNLFNQSPGFIAVLMGSKHIFELVNDAYYQLVGHRDLLGKQMFEALPEVVGQGFEEQLNDVYRTGVVSVRYGLSLKVRPLKDGPLVERYVDLVYQPFHDADGKVIGILAQGHDVTEAYQARAAEREIEARWKLALEASGGGVWDWHLQTGGLVVSPVWKAIAGYGKDELDDNFENLAQRLIHPDDLPQVRVEIEAHIMGQTAQFSSQHRLHHKDGSWVWILTRGAVTERDAEGRPLRMIGTTADISHIKQIEEELRIERDRSQAVFDTMEEGFGLIDRNWIVLYMNAEGLRLGNRTEQQVIGRNHWEIWPESLGSELERMYRRVMETKQLEIVEYQHILSDGSVIWLEIRVFPGVDEGLGIFFRDVTSRKEAEEKLRDADRRKDEFLAMLAHELRNPLAPIGAAAELLQLVKLDEVRLRKTSEVIGRQVNHMTALIDDLLDVSRVTRGLIELDKVALDIQNVVADAVEQVNPSIRARRHELTLRLAPQAAIVKGDKKRLVQVLANVLNNAAKYTTEGGHITLTTSVKASHVIIDVTDNGVGMSPATVQHAFDLFAQAERSSDRSSGGLGLGLALVKTLVELHYGTASCKSEGLGRGSTFSICLPRLLEQAPLALLSDAAKTVRPRSTTSLRVLVVDDNVDAAEMLRLLLEAKGHEVLVEHGAYQALEQAKLYKPQVCLIDIGLPEIDGNELARRLRIQSENTAAVLIAVTGYGQGSNQASTLAAGFDHHLVKPVDIPSLTSIFTTISKG